MPDLPLSSYSVPAIRALNIAAAIGRGVGAAALTTEHLLLALLNQREGNARQLLEHHFALNVHDLRSATERLVESVRAVPTTETMLATDDGARFPVSPVAVATLARAREIAALLNQPWAGTDHLLAALLDVETPAGSILRRFGVTDGELRRALERVSRNAAEGTGAGAPETGATSPLVDLIRAYREGNAPPVFDRPQYTGRMVTALAREGRHGLLLVGEPGVGKRSLVAALAQLLSGAGARAVRPVAGGSDGRASDSRQAAGYPPSGAEGQPASAPAGGPSPAAPAAPRAPAWLPGSIWAMPPAALVEDIVAAVREALAAARGGALLVPDLHLYFGGSTSPAWAEAGALLRRALGTGEPRLLGTATPAAYAKFLEPDPVLAERLTPLKVDPATADETVAILDLRRDDLARLYELQIAPSATRAGASLAKTYLPQPLPGAAVLLLESACALVRTASTDGVPYRPEGIVPDRTVDEADVAMAVHQQTGIPIGQMLGPERERLARMEEILHERVVDQDEAIRAVANAVRRSRAGLKDPKRPIGSFIFLGPSGVGKTEVARALAEFLFGSEEALIQIDMSEYMEKHTVSRLIGSPPGYVGYEEGGQLTEKVRARPYAVVLFDEIEKAHPDVFNLFLQLLEEGWLTDSKGRRVDFRNTVIIMTSNLGTEYILAGEDVGAAASSTGEGAVTAAPSAETDLPEAVRELVLEALRAKFRPEFLNRLDAVVLFKPLGPAELRQILDLFLKSLAKQLQAGPGVSLEVTEAAKAWLLAQYDEPQYGARPLRRLVDRYVKDELSARLISGGIAPGQRVRVDAGPSGLTVTPVAA